MGIGLSGGDKLRTTLEGIARKAGTGDLLRLGFLEGATYPDGTPVAYIAACNEYGGTFNVPEHETTIYRKVDASGEFTKGGQFVKQSASNFATDHTVPAHTVTTPPRPFFRQMIDAKSPGWGATMAKALKSTEYDADRALGLIGEGIKGQLQQSIRDFAGVPLAPSTIAAKGNDKQLVDSGVMLNSVDFDVAKDAA
jgi:hypothetical protein